MKKTINVNLNGRVFTIDEDAYQLLDNYLRNLRIYFHKEEGFAEIIADFESRIEELFSEIIRQGYQVINITQVEEVIARVGKPADFSEKEASNDEKQIPYQEYKEKKKKFFRSSDDRIIAGICSGLSAYFGWDVLPVRIVFFIMIFATSLWIIPAYLLFWILCPEARTAEQKLQMRGEAITVENIGKTVAAEMEGLKGMENNRGCLSSFVAFVGTFLKICFIVLGCIIGIPVFFAIILTIIILFSVLFGIGGGVIGCLPFVFSGEAAFLTVSYPILATITFIILLIIPLFTLIYGIVAYFSKPKPLHGGIKWTIFLIWILALILFLCSGFRINNEGIQINSSRCWNWNVTSDKTAIQGNGIFAEKEFFIAPIDHVTINNGLTAHLQIEQITGDSVSICVSGDENLINEIEYKVNGNDLYLSTCKDYRFHSDNNLIIRIKTPLLKGIKSEAIGNISMNKSFLCEELKIELEGTGKFEADSLTAQLLTVKLKGIGTIYLAGNAEKTDFKMEGSGKIDASELISEIVYARLEGIGTIRCNPTQYLDAKVFGIGTITYKNEPEKKDTYTIGIGKISLE
ncbi:MAG: DUF2807 domain-containing protein [Dysgonamonadaceae bacterium]|jgi:phage shock protein PspC (stress-responsive transcriptional regulator)|nr:DUF2807 domain-containing protein [Dysgonamonadaceae bacterium]